MTPPPILRVENLSHTFRSGLHSKPVLQAVSASFVAGEIVIIMGPSGSGKTTFLSLVGALRSPQEGSIKINQTELSRLPLDTLVFVRREIGFIFQSHNLVASLTACQNVQLPLQLDPSQTAESSRSRALELLELVGLKEHAHKTPRQLSGGQCQRVSIARALVRRPKIILADEPTASLDRETGREVVDILQKLARQFHATILIVTHDHRILDIADRVLLLEDGRMEELEARLDQFLAGLAALLAQVNSLLESTDEALPSPFQQSVAKIEARINGLAHLKTRPIPTRRIDLLQQMLATTRLLHDSATHFRQLALSPPTPLRQLTDRFLQGLQTLVLTAHSAFLERDLAELSSLETMTGDRQDAIARIRQHYFDAQQGLSEADRIYLFDLSNAFTRSVYLLNSVARNLRGW